MPISAGLHAALTNSVNTANRLDAQHRRRADVLRAAEDLQDRLRGEQDHDQQDQPPPSAIACVICWIT